MILITFAALAVLVLYLRQWLIPHPDHLPIHRRFPKLEVGVCLLVAGLSYLPSWQADRAADRAGKAASKVVGEKVEFVCGSQLNTFFDRGTDMAWGYVKWTEEGPAKSSKLRHETCKGLREFFDDPTQWRSISNDRLFAVHIITHETMHMAGEMSEAVTECQAVQRDALMAQALGASAEQARDMALAYYIEIYPNLRQDYYSDECKQGGKLDENLPTSPWNLRRLRPA